MAELAKNGRIAAWKRLLGPWMLAVTLLAYLWAQPLRNGFQVPDAARIIFWHVPMAMLGLLWFWIGAYHAVRFLFGADRDDLRRDTRSRLASEIGLVCTLLATVTGMVFAQVQWGVAWNWDPKQVSITVLIVVYVGYFALRASVPQPELRGRLAAVFAILGAIATPFLMYVIPNLPQVQSLHPAGDTITGRLDAKWRLIYWSATLGYLGITTWIYQLALRLDALESQAERAAATAAATSAGSTRAVRKPTPEGTGVA